MNMKILLNKQYKTNMTNFLKKTVALVVLIILSSCSNNDDSEQIDGNTTTPSQNIEADILQLINNYRASKNLTKLEVSKIIKSQTDDHTNYMISKGQISHDGFSKRSDYLKENDNSKIMAENVAIGYATAKAVVDGWISSDGHRKNIEGDYTHFNVTAKQDNSGTWYYTNIFIKK